MCKYKKVLISVIPTRGMFKFIVHLEDMINTNLTPNEPYNTSLNGKLRNRKLTYKEILRII